jgi:hypothetical protein
MLEPSGDWWDGNGEFSARDKEQNKLMIKKPIGKHMFFICKSLGT